MSDDELLHAELSELRHQLTVARRENDTLRDLLADTQEQALQVGAASAAWRSSAEELVFLLFLAHPMPWRINRDWMWEVVASDGFDIARCRTEDEAQRIVGLAEQLHDDTRLRVDP